jgi:hypothetical protein
MRNILLRDKEARMIRLAALMLFFLTSNVTGEAVIPDSPAGKALAAWLASFNSADAAQIRAFDEAYGYEPKPLDETIDWSEQTGGFTVLRIEKAEPLAIDALLGEKDSNWAAKVSTSLRPEDPSKIAKMEFTGCTRSIRVCTYANGRGRCSGCVVFIHGQACTE